MRPYIICHMMQSIDGRIACDMVDKISGDEYYTALDSLRCNAFVEGKHSYQIHYCGFDDFMPKSSSSIDAEKFHIASRSDKYNISIDTKGMLKWDDCDNGGRICIVSEQVSSEYLAYLEQLGISYIATGKTSVDLPRAMEILSDEFGIERVAVVGGGKINGAFLTSGLVNELSAMIAPGIDGRIGQPSLFDLDSDHAHYIPFTLKLKEVKTFSNGVIWARYKV